MPRGELLSFDDISADGPASPLTAWMSTAN